VPASIATDCAGALETGVGSIHCLDQLRHVSVDYRGAYSSRGWLNVQSNTSMGSGGPGDPAILYTMGTAHAVQ